MPFTTAFLEPNHHEPFVLLPLLTLGGDGTISLPGFNN